MIINKFLQMFSEEYEKDKTINQLLEFAAITFPKGADNIFIGCVIIMFEYGITGKAASREYLYSIVLSGKEKIGKGNLLDFYVKRINGSKLVSKYLYDVLDDEYYEKNINIVLDYLSQFSLDFSSKVKKTYWDKIKEYENN